MVVEHKINQKEPEINQERKDPELDPEDIQKADMFNQGIKAGLIMAARQITKMAESLPSLEEALKRES